jgi:acid phosphatase
LAVSGLTAVALPQSARADLTLAHVFVIVMENHAYGEIIGSPQAPYINGLASRYGLASGYHAVAHPSLPNYLALTGGDTFGIGDDCDTCWIDAANIADRIEAAGRSWKAYEEDLPQSCYLGDSYPYVQRHDPLVYYNDVRNDPARCDRIVPYTRLATDLAAASTTPDYAFITPNACHDMHDCSVAAGDSWLAANLPRILGSAAFTTQDSVLFITWDEDDLAPTPRGLAPAARLAQSRSPVGSAPPRTPPPRGSRQAPYNHVATLVVGRRVRAGYVSPIAYDHYSLLRTVEVGWGLPALTGNDAAASAMSDFFSA